MFFVSHLYGTLTRTTFAFLLPQATTVGAESFVAKPFSGVTLAEAIRDYAVEVVPALPPVSDDGDPISERESG